MYRCFHLIIIFLVFLGVLLLPPQLAWAQEWRPVGSGIVSGISGMALVAQQNNTLDLLIVHDSKQKNQGRLAIMTIKGKQQPEYLPLNWPSNIELPKDLEAVTSIPGNPKTAFMAVSSWGKVYDIRIELPSKTVTVLKEFNLPKIPLGSNFESFALQNIDGILVAVWADRGAGDKPATLDWGLIDLANDQITPIGTAKVRVPFPEGNVRHISDLKVDPAGTVFICAASDGGDNGPYQSAVYVAGSLGVDDHKLVWRQNLQLVPLYRSAYHKIEGLELIPGAAGGVILGTDDENFGSSVYILGASS